MFKRAFAIALVFGLLALPARAVPVQIGVTISFAPPPSSALLSVGGFASTFFAINAQADAIFITGTLTPSTSGLFG
jgi:hypothetical protein